MDGIVKLSNATMLLDGVAYLIKTGTGIGNTTGADGSTVNRTQKQILDPLSTLIRLALLKYKPDGTKIGIHNNSIWMQTPGLLQGPIRWTYGDGREDLHHLCEPLNAAARWYSTNDTPYNLIFTMAVAGLKKLRSLYVKTDPSNLVAHTLSHYIHILEGPLHTPVAEPEIPPAMWERLWVRKEIVILENLLEIVESRAGTLNIEHYLNAIEEILAQKDIEVRVIIDRQTSLAGFTDGDAGL